MANIKVSEMTEATTFDDGDYTMIVQANQNKKISKENMLADIPTIQNNISTINTNIGDLSNLQTTNKDSLVNSINNLCPTILYSNAEGSTKNITLNDNIENYDFYEITYSREGNKGFCSLKISTEYLTDISLITSIYLSNILRFYIAHITLSGNTLTRNYDNYINFTGNNALNFGSAISLSIHKVVGYKVGKVEENEV